ncbi:hypothetical protein NP233_g10230 [Leucocoprinus birnbaumii]|uniref:NADP-dependent oxidoreductase domain-containing protein n=1 Tax=Leucocoprinus birnbaumii TaxID=56174 RepID=A0AAD5YLI1_9AGAR|nr:hypothetical protein NP233_g10230 [Leucocoprinus birnbaumii]
MAETKKRIPYVRLGNSGLKVSRVILGTMQWGDSRWFPWIIEDEQEAIKTIKAAYDAGIQTFDTANVYSNGKSEVILGKAIKELKLPREEIVVITKVNGTVVKNFETNFITNGLNPDEHGYVNRHGLSRKHIFDSIKQSLKRLQLDYVDLLLCHRFDKSTPIEETMQALHDVVKAAYVRYIGMSSCWAWQFSAMQNYAITNKLTPFITMQNHYNLVYREEEREMMPTLKVNQRASLGLRLTIINQKQHFGVGAIPWAPLARGILARPPSSDKTKRDSVDPAVHRYDSAGGTAEIIRRVEEVATKRGITMGQVSLAWMLSKEGATSVTLTAQEIEYLEEPYVPQPIMGHAFNGCTGSSPAPFRFQLPGADRKGKHDDVDADNHLYLAISLKEIGESHRLATGWGLEHVETNVKNSAKLFIYATMIIRFIGDPRSLGPQAQLDIVLSYIRDASGSKNPLKQMDLLYTLILKCIPSDILLLANEILLLTKSYSRHIHNNVIKIVNVLGLDGSRFGAACSFLQSVPHLENVNANHVPAYRVQFYHASFMKFMAREDHRRSEECWLYGGCLDILTLEIIDRINEIHVPTGIDIPFPWALPRDTDGELVYFSLLEVLAHLWAIRDHPVSSTVAEALTSIIFSVIPCLLRDSPFPGIFIYPAKLRENVCHSLLAVALKLTVWKRSCPKNFEIRFWGDHSTRYVTFASHPTRPSTGLSAGVKGKTSLCAGVLGLIRLKLFN